MSSQSAKAIAEIDDVLDRYGAALKRSQYQDLSDLPTNELEELAAIMGSTFERWAPRGSGYMDRWERLREKFWHNAVQLNLRLPGFLKALQEEYKLGRLRGIEEVIRNQVFSDLLELAEVLNDDAPDASAILAGAVLEEHLRELAAKAGIPLKKQNGHYRSIEDLAADLARQGTILKTDHKSITAWYGIRTDPAHGAFNKHPVGEVVPMITGIRDFLSRFPA